MTLRSLASVQLGYDSNVFLQDEMPDPGVAGAVAPGVASVVSKMAASLTLEWRSPSGCTALASYAPETTVYSSAHGEDHTDHRLALKLEQKGPDRWQVQASSTLIAGGEAAPIFGGPGGVTALGGIPLRDRRAGAVHRGAASFERTWGAWFVRPAATVYLHDFQTVQSRAAGCANYVDRREVAGGADVGRSVGGAGRAWVGWRHFRQAQLSLLGIDSPYDSEGTRLLLGAEGELHPGLRWNVVAGPETRHFARGTPAGFPRERVRLWCDATGTVTLSARHAFSLAFRRAAQPAFSSVSFYEDTTMELAWRSRWSARYDAMAGVKAHNGTWAPPAVRKDWIVTPGLSLRRSLGRHASAEFSYAVDCASSAVPRTAGREFRRHVTSCTVNFNF